MYGPPRESLRGPEVTSRLDRAQPNAETKYRELHSYTHTHSLSRRASLSPTIPRLPLPRSIHRQAAASATASPRCGAFFRSRSPRFWNLPEVPICFCCFN
ncbi:hypothetical protein DAI22_08g199250 [Oryza sativa Japonica Group]|nr:hypothetical protein DAI22_08g199250 [Oryza sativa Japonica Group]